MEVTDLISIKTFCTHYNVPPTFINELQEYELIEIVVSNNVNYIKTTQITEVEKMIRLHFDLNINLEGLDAVYNLLQRVENLQNEITTLHNKLRLYEDL
ncbi:chaperone modulator CbpM [Lacinutrix sp. C3R15]|uniref:chaperone modulator CbpM n=1 Tax=Flavobacteriaceae TaxID=49546 RepID=UPI001C083168|nr:MULTISPECIES: chaperone modulator CbpM [Flavobacteriaceae]MBU2939777.1 chaperone modulator CbpM [Lacinutrix sp. C3R15]MDO6623092.1 chaperone modulator CbpM [Oceanihabitans sp. 1_MG-2023]